MAEIHALQTVKTDSDIAKELRARITAELERVCPICDEAAEYGMQVAFSLGLNQFGKTVVHQITISKPL